MARRIRILEDRSIYNNLAEEENKILAQSEDIFRRRLERLGSITDPTVCGNFLRARYAKYDHEIFGVVFVDNRHKIICVSELFTGCISSAEVSPRGVVVAALHHAAAGCIFFHNHPSGALKASSSDVALTLRLKSALALLEIRTLDHIIVSGEGFTSMAQEGLL